MGDVAATVVAGWALDEQKIKGLVQAKAKALLATEKVTETKEAKGGWLVKTLHDASSRAAALEEIIDDEDLDIYGIDALTNALGIIFHVVPMNGTKHERFVLGWHREDTCSHSEVPLDELASTSKKAQALATFFDLDLKAAAVHLTYSSKYDD
ncbi:Hypothetical protein POVN_LOCUS170 [uncultured virus]|nr:Hypothetical protein POVN_LOCUS170 [uncultured virus]